MKLTGLAAGGAALVLALCCSKLALADVVTDWNITALQITDPTAPGVLGQRIVAITQAAVHDAVNAVDRRYQPYSVDLKAPVGTSLDAAAASAAYTVLVAYYPLEKPTLDAALEKSLAAVSDGPARSDGVKVGREVGERIVRQRSHDGVTAKVAYNPSPLPGHWQPTPPGFSTAASTQLPTTLPFVLKSARQFDLPAPLAISSTAFVKDLEEVRRLGSIDSKDRTADQTAAAVFWTAHTRVPWNAVARQVSTDRKLTVHENARLFALLNLVGIDAYIVAYTSKYDAGFIRPVTAIRSADELGNPALHADKAWEALLISPPYPENLAGHAALSGAFEAVLRDVFDGDTIEAAVTYPVQGVTRHYKRFSQITQECEDARVWGGLHFRTSVEQGAEVGRTIGTYAVATVLRPVGGDK